MPVSAISGSREAFWLSLDLNATTSFLLNCPTHNWALPQPLPSGNWASNKQIFQIYWTFLNFLMRTFCGQPQNINIIPLFVTWSGARSSILCSNVLPVLYPRVHCPRITHASAHYRAASADQFVTPDFCWLMVAMVAQWIGG